MAKAKQNIVSFKIDRKPWQKFLKICRGKDMSGSQVLRNYITLIVDKKLRIMDKRVWEQRKARAIREPGKGS